MKPCLGCHKAMTTIPHANNRKYCDEKCRIDAYQQSGKLKLARDKANHKKWNQKAEGKEQCVICQGWYYAVCHHAWQRHDLNEREYKELIGADHKKGRIPEDLKELKRRQVFENGTVKNLKKGVLTRYIKGDKRAGNYVRSEETIKRLKRII